MLDAIAQGIQAAVGKQLKEELSADAIADILWLAAQIDVPPSQRNSRQRLQGESADGSGKGDESADGKEQQRTSKSGADLSTDTANSEPADSSHSAGAMPFKTPDAPALRNSLTLARALQPLRRKVASRTEAVFDLPATIQRITQEQIWLPVESPKPEPWLELAIVVDQSRSIGIWQRTIQELQQMLTRLGAFRSLRVWYARSEPGQPLGLYSRRGSRHQHKELIDPQGDRLIWVLSDGSSPAWYQGEWVQWLEDWGQHNIVTLVQLMPSQLWSRTVLRGYERGWLTCGAAGSANARWRFEPQGKLRKQSAKNATGMVLPVVSLNALGLGRWASAVAGTNQLAVAGYRVKVGAITVAATGAAIPTFEQFLASTSPLAQRLASLMAAVPVQLPIVRLIQRTLLPESDVTHMAEVFLSGILQKQVDAVNPDERLYEFRDGFRQQLNATLSKRQTVQVIGKLTEYVEARAGRSVRDFRAIVSLSASDFPSELRASGAVFAGVTAEVLGRLGDQYQQLLKNLPIPKSAISEIHWGELSLDYGLEQVFFKDDLVRLSPAEYRFVELFLSHPQETIASHTIVELLWKNVKQKPSLKTVHTHIKRLRRKLERAGVPEMIETVYGRGYCLKAAPDADMLTAPQLPLSPNESTSPLETPIILVI